MRNLREVAPPGLGHRKRVAGEVQRRRGEAHGAVAL
jgi:hypothetical protein